MNPYKAHNDGRKYILTVIDVFSRHVWAVSMNNKYSSTLVEAFEALKDHLGVLPKVLIYDNGTETKGEFLPFAEREGMKIVRGSTYTPVALIENYNKYMRKMIKEGFIRNKSLRWYGQPLTDYVYNRNHTKHGRLKHCPSEVWTATREPLADPGDAAPAVAKGDDHVMDQEEIQVDVYHRLKKHARRDLDRYLDEKFAVGDRVRIKLTAVDSRQRRKMKEMKGKYLVITYTPEVYTVTRVVEPSAQRLSKPSYYTSYSRTKDFFANELELVDQKVPLVEVEGLSYVHPDDVNIDWVALKRLDER
jgi:hypothetical protein